MLTLGKLRARTRATPAGAAPAAGLHGLALHPTRDTLLYVPETVAPAPVPLLVLLHGAGGDPPGVLPILRAQAEQRGFLVLVPQSQAHSWDLIASQFGPDVQQLDRALDRVFDLFAVDPRRLAIAGFSDGASYALSLGLINGDLFGNILAFSPGFAAPGQAAGRPRIFISHGVHDRILPVVRCGRRVAHTLIREGFAMDYREFDGAHEVPEAMAKAAVAGWLESHAPAA